MIETANFTPRAQQVILEAQKEAQRMDKRVTSTEHILLAILKVDAGVASTVLKKLGITYDKVKIAIKQEIP